MPTSQQALWSEYHTNALTGQERPATAICMAPGLLPDIRVLASHIGGLPPPAAPPAPPPPPPRYTSRRAVAGRVPAAAGTPAPCGGRKAEKPPRPGAPPR